MRPAAIIIDLVSSDDEDDCQRKSGKEKASCTDIEKPNDNSQLTGTANSGRITPVIAQADRTVKGNIRISRSQSISILPLRITNTPPRPRSLSAPLLSFDNFDEDLGTLIKDASTSERLKNKPGNGGNESKQPAIPGSSKAVHTNSPPTEQRNKTPCQPQSSPSTPTSSKATHLTPPNRVPITKPSNPSTPKAASNSKRKPTDNLSNNNNKRARLTAPLPATPPITPRRPAAPPPQTPKSILWSTPQYQGPDANTKIAPLPHHPPTPTPTPTTTPKSHTPISKSTTSPPSQPIPLNPSATKETPWTTHQLLLFAQDLQNAFDFPAFANRHKKFRTQVLDAFEFLVLKPVFEYAAEGGEVEKGGRARGFERAMREDIREGERVLGEVNKREREGMGR